MAKHHFSLLIESISGQGKSYLASLIISLLKKELKSKRILIIDPQDEYEIPGFKAVVLSPKNYRKILKKLPEIIEKYKYLIIKFDRITLNDMKKLADFIARVAFIVKNIVLVFDEAHLFVDKYKPGKYVQLVSVMGRKEGIDSIFITQRPQQLNTTIRSQTNFKIVGKMVDDRDKNAVRSYLGKYADYLDLLPQKHFLFKDESGKLYITSTEGWKIPHKG